MVSQLQKKVATLESALAAAAHAAAPVAVATQPPAGSQLYALPPTVKPRALQSKTPSQTLVIMAKRLLPMHVNSAGKAVGGQVGA